MARGDQLGRQWKIIQTLITSQQGKSAAELSSDLDIHPRTVYRDLVALQLAGFPIYTERMDEIRAESEAILGKYGGEIS